MTNTSAGPCFFVVYLRNFSAASLSLVFVTKLSRTAPSRSTERQRQYRSPLIFTKTSSSFHCQRVDFIPSIRRLRISAVTFGVKRCNQNRTVSRLKSMLRSCRRTSTFLRESGRRTYNITARRMISSLFLKYLSGSRFFIPGH